MSTITAPAPPPVAPPDPIPVPAQAHERLYTLDEMLDLEQGDHSYELVDGRLEELNVGVPAAYVAQRVCVLLGNHCGLPPIAYVLTENGFACFSGRKGRMRKPDVSVILVERLTAAEIAAGFTPVRPDIAIEVISPKDQVVQLEVKLDDYRSAGIPLVWLVYPSLRRVHVLPIGGPTVTLGPDDELTGGAVLPDFRCKVSDLFAGLPEPPPA